MFVTHRPITIPTRRQNSSPPSMATVGEESSFRTLSIPCPPRPCFSTDGQERRSSKGSSTKSHIGFSSCCFSPPETTSLDPSFFHDTTAGYNHLQHHDHNSSHSHSDSDSDSPSSVISSVFPNHTAIIPTCFQDWNRPEFEQEKVEEDGEAAESSYFIELDSRTTTGFKDAAGDAAVDEAIAWAKETFRSHQGSKEEDDDDDDDDDLDLRINSKETSEDMDSSSRWVS